MKGWALAATGKHDEGISQLTEGIGKYIDTGSQQMLPYARALLADAYGRAGRIPDGMRVVHELEEAHASNEVRFFDGCTERIAARLRAVTDSRAAGMARPYSPPPGAHSAPDNRRVVAATRSREARH